MSTRSLVPRASGEAGIGAPTIRWGTGNFNTLNAYTGAFTDTLTISGVPVSTGAGAEGEGGKWLTGTGGGEIYYSGGNVGVGFVDPSVLFHVSGGDAKFENDVQISGDLYVSGDSYFSPNTISIGDQTISSDGDFLSLSSTTGMLFSGGTGIKMDASGIMRFSASGLKVGDASVMPDPTDTSTLYFEKVPQVMDAEGQPTTILTADKLGLGTAAVLETDPGDIKFKLLTDQDRFVVGTTGEPGGLESGWYRFNDFKVKGSTDIGAYPLNPVDTRIYSDESSFILFTTDVAGNRVAHLVGGDEPVSPNNAMALGIAVKVDADDTPDDIEFVHTDGESYSVINGDSDSVGTNGLPVRQGFQSASIGSNPVPLLIDGGYF